MLHNTTACPVIVTRPADDAAVWVQALQQAGFAAEALPLIEIAPSADAQALTHAWQQLPNYSACLFVSRYAVQGFFQGNQPQDQSNTAPLAIKNIANLVLWPARTRCLAPGPGTVAALLAAGVPPAHIDQPAADALQWDTAALWQVIGARAWAGCRVLVVRGDSAAQSTGATASVGRDWIVQQWQAAGAQVDFCSVYQRRAPLLSVAQLARARAAATDGSVWLLSSSEALGNLLQALAASPEDAPVWQQARAIATHPRIAQAAHAAGWGQVLLARPTLADIQQHLQSIESVGI